jgi:hypothetical protein
MSKMKAKWINLDSNTLSAAGDNLAVHLDNDTLSADAGGLFINSVSGDVIAAGSIPDSAHTNPLLKADGLFTDGTGVFTGSIDLNGNSIVNLVAPASPLDGANKAYVDAVAQGLDTKSSCTVATTVSAAGSYVTTPSNGRFTDNPSVIDGITLVNGDRILVKDQPDATQNGIYTAGSTTTIWTRATDHDGTPTSEVSVGNFTFIESGTVNSDAGYVLQKDGVNDGILTLNIHNLNWTQFSGAGAIIAGDGLTKVGNTLSANVDDSSIEINADTLRVKASGITNAMLANDSITLSGGNGLTGGGGVALGTTGTLDVDPTQLVTGGDAQIDGDNLHIDFTPSTYSDPSDDTLSGQLNAIDTFLGTVGTGDGNVSAGVNFTDNVLIKGIGGTKHVEETTITIDDSNNLTTAGDIYVSGDVVVDGQAYSVEYDAGTTGSVAIDWDNGNVQHVTLSGNSVITESNANAGSTYILIVEQDGTGGHTITWPVDFTWPGGAPPDVSTGASEVNVVATVYSGVDSTHYADIRNDEPLNAADLANLPTEITDRLTLATAGSETSAALSQTPISVSNVKMWPEGGPMQGNIGIGGSDFTVLGTTITAESSAGFVNGDDIYVTYEYTA